MSQGGGAQWGKKTKKRTKKISARGFLIKKSELRNACTKWFNFIEMVDGILKKIS